VKILVAHNFYQHSGGEDAVCASEIALLREGGHCVVEYLLHNDEIKNYSFLQKASLGWRVSWSPRADRELREILIRESPEVAHFHNTFPLISPSAYYACRAAGVPVVQTLHNFRLLCPAANLFRSGGICMECVHHSLSRSISHACYHDSRIATAAVAGMLAVHRILQTWDSQVDLFFVCSEFARQTFIGAGWDEARLRVKPNFIPRIPEDFAGEKNTALFLGRLSPEKGPQLLPLAWSKLAEAIPLEIAGEGPLRIALESECARRRLRNVHFFGWLGAPAAMNLLRSARFLIVPSVCYEGFPLVVVEAYASGVPVIVAGHGGLAEIVSDGSTGLHFRPGDAEDLSVKVAWAWTHPREMETIGQAARAEFETKYTAGAALEHLEAGYEFAMRRRNQHTRALGMSVQSRPLSLTTEKEEID
jgi:glycosyltransferase involved in cell wall biosynthesis